MLETPYRDNDKSEVQDGIAVLNFKSPCHKFFALIFSFLNDNTPCRESGGGVFMGSLALTYFRERKLTIIGALLFHGPVRDGKGWYQQAIDARRNL